MLTSFFRKSIRVASVVGVMLGGVCFVALPISAQTAVTSQVSSDRLFDRIGHTFWDAEDQLHSRVKPFSKEPSPYKKPLSRDDVLYQKYFYVDKTSSEYLQIIDKENPQSWTVPPVLYLGGLAAFTIGDYANAEKRLSRLVTEFPKYSRNLYINDRDAPNPDFAQPVKPGISKLLFYCQIHQILDSRLRGNDDANVGARGGASRKRL